jgi:hypothetical protein
MNELAKAVLVLALSTAAAVWLLGAALHLWPSADQLAYGNPLPYLKIKFDRSANAVKFWVEDFGGVPYERVWLYVNGQLARPEAPAQTPRRGAATRWPPWLSTTAASRSWRDAYSAPSQ